MRYDNNTITGVIKQLSTPFCEQDTKDLKKVLSFVFRNIPTDNWTDPDYEECEEIITCWEQELIDEP